MEYTDSVGSASVSNLPHHNQKTTSETEKSDTDSILSLVNKLEFNIDEQDKKQFFDELESAIISELEQEGPNNYNELINFFIKHTKPNGKIA